MLAATEVSFAYGARPVVDQVTLVVPTGRVVGLLGANGAGKTTLLNMLAGIRRPSTGQVALDGRDLTTVSRREAAQCLALVPQETHAAFDFSVLEVVLMGRFAHLGAFEIEGPDDIAVAGRALRDADAWQFASRRFSTLSGGEKQRVIIAAALAQLGVSRGRVPERGRSAVMLLDEPTSSLDLRHQLVLRDLLRHLNQQVGLTIVVSTHDLSLAGTLCDDLVFLRDGRVVVHGPPQDTLTPATVRDVFDVDLDTDAWWPALGPRADSGRARDAHV